MGMIVHLTLPEELIRKNNGSYVGGEGQNALPLMKCVAKNNRKKKRNLGRNKYEQTDVIPAVSLCQSCRIYILIFYKFKTKSMLVNVLILLPGIRTGTGVLYRIQ